MKFENESFPILYWPRKSANDGDYQMARKIISGARGAMPEIISRDLDIADVFAKNPNAVLYYPVFCESTGWWGELLGSQAEISKKIIVSTECQLMEIRGKSAGAAQKSEMLLAAEIYPTSGFFKKMSSQVATVADMLATDSGSILALFSGKNQNKFIQVLESTGNAYLGCIGGY
ncbi:MAG: hypothetical protein LBJ18_01905 [Rickettsiales bacterium]|jgi:hypothetical protein|nr:hypothetical protein [Rickettsiales bacterium]